MNGAPSTSKLASRAYEPPASYGLKRAAPEISRPIRPSWGVGGGVGVFRVERDGVVVTLSYNRVVDHHRTVGTHVERVGGHGELVGHLVIRYAVAHEVDVVA